MGLFGSKREGGLMDVIRCDEKDFLIWKWSPDGGISRKENAIRYGSSLRVKDGEVAVFVYKQKDGTMQDFIVGPFDETIKTANFPVLTSIVGSAFGGASPFQAEIYFINLASNLKVPFFIREFDVADSRFLDYVVPVTVKGVVTFNIQDYKGFIKHNRMIDFSLEEFSEKVRQSVVSYAKSVITGAPSQLGIPVIQIERGLMEVGDLVKNRLKVELEEDFGVNVARVNISDITLNKDSDGYRELRAVTADLQTQTLEAQTQVGIKNLGDQQAINAEHYAETLRVQREETQRAQRLQTESAHLSAHQINVQGDVAKTAAQSLGELGGGMGGMGGGDGFNPAGMMTGMMMGGAVGGSMSNMMGNMMQDLNQPKPPTPPAGATAQYHASINGQQSGPYTLDQLKQMVVNGQFTSTTLVWKNGMGNWEPASNVQEMAALFGSVPPPMPSAPTPPPPPTAQTPPPPPAGAMAEYHVSINGQQSGPYTLDQLKQMITGGQFTQAAHVWKTGMPAWEPASNVQEVAGLFGSVPPPPPVV
ncbi:GYF domain-containing protein [Porphyromonadaceae bacterium OttesenSCG-928-L07]|nr:GYF domain-containing protein [Porphyromonadaceae bacterium OttesenSCG-928-L07]MDL2251960.1 GYF domain-containing protein [Odoribacter sp. OttesenSCG-928-J03]MDL2283292.1 GYF domain-containing protein [Odoribacter sp. OttesenSCG-928-G04]